MDMDSYVQINSSEIRLDSLVQGSLILIMAIVIILSNIVIIASYINYKGPMEVVSYYFLSLSVCDLICGLFVVPLSVYPALVGEWIYGSYICRAMGYIEVTLWCVCMYTCMWISVDRYLAVRKPLRYETVQIKTRCQCYMVFSWLSAALLCCPPFLGLNEPVFDKAAYICMLDWGNMIAYSATLTILVLGPSVLTIIYNYGYIFLTVRWFKSGKPIQDKEYATALAETFSNPNHLLSCILVFMFLLCWTPFFAIRLYELVTAQDINIPLLKFGVVWFGISNSFWKFVIMVMFSPNFRLTLKIFCLTAFCKASGRLQNEMVGLDED